MTIDMTKPWEFLPQGGEEWEKGDNAQYIGQLNDSRHVLKDNKPGYCLFIVDKIRNTPEPEPTENWWELPVERLMFKNHAVVAKSNSLSERGTWLCLAQPSGSLCVTYQTWMLNTDITILPPPPPRKSLGWMNVYSDGAAFFHQSRQQADDSGKADDGSEMRIACVEIFEGDGL